MHIVVIIAFVLLLFGAYLLGKGESVPSLLKVGTQPAKNNWKSYTDVFSNFSFSYPTDWGVEELSGTLVVAPQATITKVRELKQNGGGFGGGTFLVMQFIVQNSRERSDYASSSERTVTTSQKTISGVSASVYTSTFKVDLPGISIGSVITTYILPLEAGKELVIDILDKQYLSTAQQIVDSVRVTPTETLIGKTSTQIKQLKGEPTDAAINDQTKKEIWVYAATGEDPTATYIYFTNGKVSQVANDEYNGDLTSNSWIK